MTIVHEVDTKEEYRHATAHEYILIVTLTKNIMYDKYPLSPVMPHNDTFYLSWNLFSKYENIRSVSSRSVNIKI